MPGSDRGLCGPLKLSSHKNVCIFYFLVALLPTMRVKASLTSHLPFPLSFSFFMFDVPQFPQSFSFSGLRNLKIVALCLFFRSHYLSQSEYGKDIGGGNENNGLYLLVSPKKSSFSLQSFTNEDIL